MNILALETSMANCSVAVLKVNGESRTLLCREEPMAKGHAEVLMPMLAEVMQDARIDFSELQRVAATLGPGSFTGVRIAIAAARALVLVTPARLWGTDTLSVIARSAFSRGVSRDRPAPFAVAMDARAGQLYFGLFDAEGRKLHGPSLLSPEEAAALLPRECGIAVGSGAEALSAAALPRGLQIDVLLPDLQPSAAALAELGFEAKETLPTLRPLYLRAPDAKPQAGAVARR